MSSRDVAPMTARPRGWSVSTLLAGVLFGFLLLAALLLASRRPAEQAAPERPAVVSGGGGGEVTPVALAGDSVLVAASDPRAIDVTRRTAIVAAAERAGPAVVTLSVVQTRLVQTAPLPFRDDFFEPFFRDMVPQYRYREQIPSMGSGFVISGNGYV